MGTRKKIIKKIIKHLVKNMDCESCRKIGINQLCDEGLSPCKKALTTFFKQLFLKKNRKNNNESGGQDD